MTGLEIKWRRLPEAIRWILCWPVILSGIVIYMAILGLVLDLPFKNQPFFDNSGEPVAFFNFIEVIFAQWVVSFTLFSLIFRLVPRGQHVIAIITAIFLATLAFISAFELFLQFRGHDIDLWNMGCSIVLCINAAASALIYALQIQEEINNSGHHVPVAQLDRASVS